MEDQHMTQQEFADFLQQSPATLSSIFNGRTRPTLKILDAIKNQIPDIRIEWLLYGTGEMFNTSQNPSPEVLIQTPGDAHEGMFNFDSPVSTPTTPPQSAPSAASFQHGVRNTQLNFPIEEVKNVDKQPRKVTEIRVYYDDQTYETFIPAKK